MPYNPAIHNRHSIRLPGFDYSQAGAYFLTINSHKKEHLFGSVVAGVVRLTPVGEIAREQWLKIPEHFSNILLDEFVIMPNHMHGILVITEDDVRKGKAFDRKLPKFPIKCFTPTPTTPTTLTTPTPTTGSAPGSIPAVVQNFKSDHLPKVKQATGNTWCYYLAAQLLRRSSGMKRIKPGLLGTYGIIHKNGRG
jgi:hypothetical protein